MITRGGLFIQYPNLQEKKRFQLILILFIVLFISITIRLAYVQFVKGSSIYEKAEMNWDREIPFSEERGRILDRNGTVIVDNTLAPTLYFMPSQNQEIEKTARILSSVLEVDEKRLLEKLSKKDFLVKLAPEGKNISTKKAFQIERMHIPGLYVGVDYIRAYPYGELLSRFLGFTGIDQQGLAGIEYQYDQLLKSSPAKLRLFTDAKGLPMPHVNDQWKSGDDGKAVQLTVNMDIQRIVEKELRQAMLTYKAEQAMAIVTNPQTGEILSIASFPTFHPLQYDKVSNSIYNQNLPVSMTFEPGSTFKIVTLAAAVNEKKVNLQQEHFYDPGYSIVEGSRLRCWKREGHGSQTFLEVVENSCNPGFIALGQRIGKDKLLEYIHNFGFGQKTNSGISGESTGILFSKEAFGPVEHATTSFGQGVSVTPIQQVQAIGAVINGGHLLKPYVVSRFIDEKTGKMVSANKRTEVRTVVTEETSKIVRQALESVVANGSGRNAFRDHLRIAGKTGTAQKVVNGRYAEGAFIVSFIGFAPANDPQVLVYVAIDHPKDVVQFGGVIAAPIVGQIIEESAPLLHIQAQEEQLEKEYRWGDPLERRVPELVGMKKEDLYELDEPFKIIWHGKGEQIISQIPKSNTLLPIDGTIHLYTN